MMKIIMPMARPATVSVTQVDGTPMNGSAGEREQHAAAAAADSRAARLRQRGADAAMVLRAH